MIFTVITEEECRRKYEHAEDKFEMLEILSGLTACSNIEMAKFLGCEIPYKYNRGGPHVTIGKKYFELYNQGLTDQQIADGAGVKIHCVKNWRYRHGIPAND